jgi:hypothetical protein
MAIKSRLGGYLCGYCGKSYADAAKADFCRESHDLIYVPLTKADLNRLILFLNTKDDEVLTRTLVDTLQRYLRGS